MRRILSLLVGAILIAVGVYIIIYIPTAVDFSQVIIRLEDNDTIYRFLIYIPIIVCLYNAVLAIFNVIVESNTLNVINLVLCIGVIVYLQLNVMGSVTAVPLVGEKLDLLMYTNVGTSLIILFDIIYTVVKSKNKKKIKA